MGPANSLNIIFLILGALAAIFGLVSVRDYRRLANDEKKRILLDQLSQFDFSGNRNLGDVVNAANERDRKLSEKRDH